MIFDQHALLYISVLLQVSEIFPFEISCTLFSQDEKMNLYKICLVQIKYVANMNFAKLCT